LRTIIKVLGKLDEDDLNFVSSTEYKDLIENINNEFNDENIDDLNLIKNYEKCGDVFIDLLLGCLEFNPNNRLSI